MWGCVVCVYVRMIYSPLFSTLLNPLSSPLPFLYRLPSLSPPPSFVCSPFLSSFLSPQVQMAAWTAKNGPMSVAAYALPWKHYKSGILTSGCR